MNDTLKMYGSIGSEIMNRYFVVAMCFKSQPRWRRLQTTYGLSVTSQIFVRAVFHICANIFHLDNFVVLFSFGRIPSYRTRSKHDQGIQVESKFALFFPIQHCFFFMQCLLYLPRNTHDIEI